MVGFAFGAVQILRYLQSEAGMRVKTCFVCAVTVLLNAVILSFNQLMVFADGNLYIAEDGIIL